MITIPELTAQALGAFLTSETKGRFGSSPANLPELLPRDKPQRERPARQTTEKKEAAPTEKTPIKK